MRHGESEGNADHTLYRTKPDNLVELTEKGIRQAEDAGATLSISELNFKLLMVGQKDAMTLMSDGELEIDGDAGALAQLAGLFDQFERRFPIVTPRPAWEA